MTRRILTALVALLLSAALGQADAQPKTIKIALIAKSEANFVFLSARRGAEAKAAELSRTLGIPITIDWLTPPREDVAQQAARIRQAVGQHANAILLSASDGAALVSAVNEAVDAGVEVMTFDSDVPGSKRFAFYGPDDEDLGEKVAHDVMTLMGGKGQAAVLAGSPNANNLKARAEGARRAFARDAGIEFLGVVNHVETPVEAVNELLKFDEAHPQLTGWAMVGGWPLFRSSQSLAMMNEIQKRNLKVVAVDALPEQLVYLERGLVPVLWAQPVYDWGTIGVSTIVDKLRGKTPPKTIRMEPIRVTKDDLKEYAQKLHSWGFIVPQEYLAK
jgi:ribose transport system substrate-binding protein